MKTKFLKSAKRSLSLEARCCYYLDSKDKSLAQMQAVVFQSKSNMTLASRLRLCRAFPNINLAQLGSRDKLIGLWC